MSSEISKGTNQACDRTQALREIHQDLTALRQRILSNGKEELARFDLEKVRADALFSLYNLFYYIVMRREDLHPLQSRLAAAGASSLGRVEPHVMGNIDCVIDLLDRATQAVKVVSEPDKGDFSNRVGSDPHLGGYRLLKQRAEWMFGKRSQKRSEYIMVTMPTEAAEQPELAERLVASGMDVARINCAHDEETVWQAMTVNIRRAAEKRGRSCRIFMDLAGHKIRTGQVVMHQDKAKKNKKNKKGDKKPRRVHREEYLVLCKEGLNQNADDYFHAFDVPVAAVINCTYPGVIDQVECHQPVWIDDGKIGTLVREKQENAVLLQITQAAPKGVRLKEEKGLNFPETQLDLSTLSEKDCRDLDFVSRYADIVGLSFVEAPEDILFLQSELEKRGAGHQPIVAKIETAHGVRNLPQVTAHALSRNINVGIMIARGDLAVELGSVRMAEIQEEILRVCEAAHVPVVWATQVLETLAKEGTVSRPEITDAAMSERAECVMLNKGPYIEFALTILGEVLQRMEGHQYKSHSHMRALHW